MTFIFSHYRLCKMSAQIIECKIYAPYELSTTISTLWYNRAVVLSYGPLSPLGEARVCVCNKTLVMTSSTKLLQQPAVSIHPTMNWQEKQDFKSP